ncbi:MAG: MATE family efflux transporter [Enterocloster bolteae]
MMQLIESTKEMFRDSRFLRKALMIACPVALQGMLNTVVNLVDTLMIGTMGATAIAAVGLANKFFFVFRFWYSELSAEAAMLAAQFWGNSDLRSIRKVLGLSILLALTGALFFVVPALVFPNPSCAYSPLSHDSVELGSKYLKIAVLTYPFLAMTNVYVAILRSSEQGHFPCHKSSCISNRD